MSHSKKLISDGVLYKLAGGIPPPGFPVHERDIWSSLDNKINSLFKLKHFDTTLPSGETLPEAAMIATYENITVTSVDGGKSKSTLPIVPITLPKNMGIYLVYYPKHPENPFIPLQRGQLALLRADQLLNDLGGQIGYEPKNTEIIFTKDLTMYEVTAVTMELCVFEISSYSVTAELPVPADYIDQLQTELINEFAPVLAKSGIVSNFVNPTQNVPK